jgi:hypothetical protein
MTPQLQAAIAAIQSPSHTERQQLLQILTQSESDPTSVGRSPRSKLYPRMNRIRSLLIS